MGCRKLSYYQHLQGEAKEKTPSFLRVVWKKNEKPVKKFYNYYPGGMLQPGRNFNSNSYRYGGAGGQEMDNEIYGSVGTSYTAEYWQYDSRLLRRWNTDPVTKPWKSPYATFGNNPIYYIDPTGECEDCPKEATELNTASKQGTVEQGQVWKDTKGSTFEYDKDLGWLPSGTNPTDNTKPVELGVEYFTGGTKEHNFTAGDPFTEILKQSSHIEDTREHIANNIGNIEQNREYPYGNDLSGLAGIPKYAKDYSSLVTLGTTGNLAATYLGSYTLNYKVTELDIKNKTARVQFSITNYSTIASLTHPPYFGYLPFWNKYIGNPLNELIPSSGPMSETKQTLNWSETIKLK